MYSMRWITVAKVASCGSLSMLESSDCSSHGLL